MKNSIGRRFLAFLLTTSIFASLLISVPVLASAASLGIGEQVYEFLGKYVFDHSLLGALSEAVDFRFQYYDDVSDDPSKLEAEITRYNSSGWLNRLLASNPAVLEAICTSYEYVKYGIVPIELRCQVKEDSAHGGTVRLAFPDGTWIVDSDGHYPYCSKEAWSTQLGENVPSTLKPFDGRWLTTNSMDMWTLCFGR